MRQVILMSTPHAEQANEAARQAQAQLMMGRLSAAAAGISSAACNGTSSAAERDPLVILCGDFNDSPPSPACQVCYLLNALFETRTDRLLGHAVPWLFDP